METVKRFGLRLQPHGLAIVQSALLVVLSFVIFTAQASGVIRFNNRSLLIYDSNPGATTKYLVSFTYNNLAVPSTTVGSIDMLFCQDPIPTDPCDVPAGLDVSGAQLTAQTGVTGFSILSKSSNHIVLTRTPGVVGETPSSYMFENMVNPTTNHSFSIRLSDYSSIDASGLLINLGSVLSEAANGIVLETQVPPMLIFCVAQQVSQNCTQTDGGNYSDLGDINSSNTLTASSQMAAGTNASNGYVITANGPPLEAGSNVITAPDTPTVSAPGTKQFGINLVANSVPSLGSDPDGDFTNAVVAPNYDTANKYMYKDGDIIATAPNVSLVRRFTVSYIVNTSPSLRAGVYTTTITYICSGRF